MDMSELTAYANDKYGISELRKWSDFPGFSVLCHPKTGKWAALLIRQWDSETGREIQHCDLRSGQPGPDDKSLPFLSGPVRMKGSMWVGIAFDETTLPEVVFRLFDKAIAAGEPRAFTIVLDSKQPQFGKAWPDTPLAFAGNNNRNSPSPSAEIQQDTPLPFAGNENRNSASPSAEIQQDTPLPFAGNENRNSASSSATIWQDTPLPFAGSQPGLQKPAVPERLREMRRLYEYGRTSEEARARNFCRQGKFMEDFEDDYPWEGDFFCCYPTYHDMTTKELRGYFSWRTKARRGEFGPLSASAAYIYIYELLNGIGADSAADSLRKLRAFEEGFLDSGIGDARIRPNLRRWMLDLAIIGNLPAESARACADPAMLAWDQALSVLKNPADEPDEAVFSALSELAGRKLDASPVLAADPERGRHLFAEAWRTASAGHRLRDKDLFTLCFGTQPVRVWEPFSRAVYLWKCRQADFIYHLTDCRSFGLQNGVWKIQAYEKLYFDKERLRGFIHETDLLLRRYLKTGRYLKEKPANAWAAPYVEQVIDEDRKAAIEAARPKINLDLTGLDKIRRDALTTQESLLAPLDLDDQNTGASADGQISPALSPEDKSPSRVSMPQDGSAFSDEALRREDAGLSHGGLRQPTPDLSQRNLGEFSPDLSQGDLEQLAPDLSQGDLEQLAPDLSQGDLEQLAPDLLQGNEKELSPDSSPADKIPESQGPSLAFPAPGLPLDDIHLQILRALLSGESPDQIIQTNHLMPSIVADTVNEAFFEEIGDTVLICENDRLSLMEDYIEDLTDLLEDQ